MDDRERSRWRRRLETLREDLRARAGTARDATRAVELDPPAVGRLSRMDALQAQQMARATEQRRQAQLRRIEGALRRLEGGDFGTCHGCGEPIDPRRLDADPTLTRCIDCSD
jgi:DnaK suppressor protein